MQVRTRFAPSPTGYMHLGGMRTAMYAWLFARKNKGAFILRLEDTDQERYVPGAEQRIYDALRHAGLLYDEGPDIGGDYGPYVQTERRALYVEYAKQLVEKGKAYPCFCTKERLEEMRAECEARKETFKYDKHCLHLPKDEVARRIAAGEAHVIRIDMPTEGTIGFDDVLYGRIDVACQELDDMILLKSDGLPTYNFANVVDDHLMEITHVMRGMEYLSSTPKYNLLYEAFGWEKPVYIHLNNIMRDATHKLSKRHGDATYEELLARGYLPEAILNYIALLGWNPGTTQEFFTLEELKDAFSIEGLSKSPSIFDMNKLTWFNWEYIRRLPLETYIDMAKPWLEAAGAGRFDRELLCGLLHTRTEAFEQIASLVDFLVQRLPIDPALYTHKKMKSDIPTSIIAIRANIEALSRLPEWSGEALHDAMMGTVALLGLKNSQVLWPVRVALSGKASTAGGAIEIAQLLGREETMDRLRAALAQLEAIAI